MRANAAQVTLEFKTQMECRIRLELLAEER